MRKFISRAAALLLAGVMTAAVAGCGKNSDSEAKDTEIGRASCRERV